MIGSLINVDNVGTVTSSGSFAYRDATYTPDAGVPTPGVALDPIGPNNAIGLNLACLNGLWLINDANGVPHIVEGGQATCIISGVTPDLDADGVQEATGTISYTNLVIHPPFLKYPSNPLVAWIAAANTWGYIRPLVGGG